MKSFRDPTSNVLTAWGHVAANGDDLMRDEPEDFNLEPGRWKLEDGVWIEMPVDPRPAILAQIDQLERAAMLNRGSREIELVLMQEKAQEYADQNGLTLESVLARNPYYNKVKELDDQVNALRELL